jgi:hypothetical protein
MENKKITAIDWLDKELGNLFISHQKGFMSYGKFIYLKHRLFKQAKEMEKEQMNEVSWEFWNEGAGYMYDGKKDYESFEQYYKETYE